jgi:hypothetical protein
MTATQEKAYSVKTLRSGQPRAYADTEREYLIACRSTQYGKQGLHPYVLYGDIEKQIKHEEAERAAGRMSGGMSPDQLRKAQRDWALKLVRALCQNFREKNDDDGRTGMEAHFYPTLETLTVDASAGTIRAFIIEPYTD